MSSQLEVKTQGSLQLYKELSLLCTQEQFRIVFIHLTELSTLIKSFTPSLMELFRFNDVITSLDCPWVQPCTADWKLIHIFVSLIKTMRVSQWIEMEHTFVHRPKTILLTIIARATEILNDCVIWLIWLFKNGVTEYKTAGKTSCCHHDVLRQPEAWCAGCRTMVLSGPIMFRPNKGYVQIRCVLGRQPTKQWSIVAIMSFLLKLWTILITLPLTPEPCSGM